jgi:hypothetical protein
LHHCEKGSFDLIDIAYPISYVTKLLEENDFENVKVLPSIPIDNDIERANFIDKTYYTILSGKKKQSMWNYLSSMF